MKKLLLTTLLLLSAAGMSSATAWNLADNFSAASNPGGVWSYGYKTELNGTLNLFDDKYTGNYDIFFHSKVDDYGNIGMRMIDPPDTSGGMYREKGQVNFHPGFNTDFVTVRWTSPVTGRVRISSVFAGANTEKAPPPRLPSSRTQRCSTRRKSTASAFPTAAFSPSAPPPIKPTPAKSTWPRATPSTSSWAQRATSATTSPPCG